MSLSVTSGEGVLQCADVPPVATLRRELPPVARPQWIHIPPRGTGGADGPTR